MSTWCWTPSSLDTWKRYIKKKCGKDVNQPCQMAKHKVIAQTWAKRKELEEKGRLSITLYNTHTDPVGLNFDVNDLNSSETNEISSTWANYLPQFVKRRMALTGITTTNNNSSSHGPRRNSLDSEISISLRHVSVESRRNSVDSQVSVKIAEMKTKVAARSRNRHSHYNQHKYTAAATNKRSQRRRDFIASTIGRKYSRRESSTSIESQVIALKKNVYSNTTTGQQSQQKLGLFSKSTKHAKRRSANAGLDAAYVSDFLAKNGQFFIPFLQNHEIPSNSNSDEADDDQQHTLTEHKTTEVDDSATNKEEILEHLFKIMQKSNESTKRNSRKSWRSDSNKSLNLDIVPLPKHKLPRDSVSSYTSADLDLPHGLTLNSSFSALSISGKPLSRNSKTSCDVGIQANSYEISTQTFNDKEAKNVKLKLRPKSKNFGEEAEMQTLLGSKQIKTENEHIKQRETIITLTESEKLKMLLLPSK